MSDLQIIHKRKVGYTLKEIHDYYITCNPCLDELVCLTHVVQVCHQNNLAFTPIQVLKVLNKHYSKEFHGDKKSYLEWINRWTSNKMLVFKTEGSKKVCCRPPILEKTGDSGEFSGESDVGHMETEEGLILGGVQ